MHALNSFLSKMESERKQNPNILPHQLAQQVQISWCTKRNPPNNSDCHGTWGGNYKDEEQNARNLITGQGGFFAAGGSENGGNSLSPGGTGDIEDVTAAACSGVYGNMDMTGAIPNFQVVNKKDGLTYTLDFLPGGQRGATIKAAITQLGVPYQLNADNWAEHPPDGLLDCSALTKGAVQRGAGIKLTHQSAIQYTEMKKKYGSAQSKALPGDLVFFGDGGPSGIDHVAIYLGSGTIEGQSGKYPIMIAAPKTGDVVKLQKVYKHNNLYGDPGYQDVASDLTLVAGNGAVTSPLKPGSYSYTLPYNKFTAGNHLGIDLIIKRGEPIYAVADGKVIISMCGSPDGCRSFNNTSMTGCGWYVKLYHADGNFNSMYCHMNQRPNVSKGDTVKKGQVLGYIGSTGHSGTPHLHFEIRQPPSKTGSGGTPIDPVPFMQARGVKIG
jgi:murein DD-endopeptidase MepM/ murein hydrolase activator NlpD